MLFPNLTNFHPKLKQTILNRAGNNQYVSGLVPWIRVVASTGLVLESIPATDSFDQRYGFTKDGVTRSGRVGTDLAGNSVYADENDRMFRPSPVIEGLGVSFGAGGLTRKCNFAIKCFTLAQAEKVMEYFMEPGYTCLVEYGWNTSESFSQRAELSTCGIVLYNSYEKVKNKQINSNFTYDGFLGYITNGGFKSGDGETFTIEVELTSLGEPAAYLQQHRGASDINEKSQPGGKMFTNSDINATDDVGTALFKQMFNRLPNAKQSKEVKALMNGVDSRGTKWTHTGNFINMDEVIKDKLIDALSDTAVASEGEGAEIPDGTPLVSDMSYIRLELAFEILNNCGFKMPSIDSGCSGVGTFPFTIEYKNTVIRAHKYLFSTDPTKLIVPNPLTPDFGLIEALTSTKEGESFAILDASGVPTKTIDLNQFKEEGNTFAFPQQTPLSDSGYKWKPDAIPFNAGPGEWGYLKDLFINFEFFISVLEKSNYVAKDIYYEMLNGLSTAANSIWHFDIMQLPSDNGTFTQLEIVDLNFCGNVPDAQTKFRFSGADSPFISATLNFDIPASMKNMIVAERMAGEGGEQDPSSEGNLPQRLWSTKTDPVLEKISNFNKKVDAYYEEQEKKNNTNTNNTARTTTTPEKVTEEDIRKQNYELFMSKASVVPVVKDRRADIDAAKNAFLDFFGIGSTDTNLENLVVVAAWNDTSLFRKLDTNTRSGTTANNVLLEIAFDFDIHGVSGIKTGDLFEIEDLPSKYKNTLFQVVSVSHGLDGNMWKTSVTGKMRKKEQLETS